VESSPNKFEIEINLLLATTMFASGESINPDILLFHRVAEIDKSDQMTCKRVATAYTPPPPKSRSALIVKINLRGITLEYDAGDRYDFLDTVINLRRFIPKMRRINA
jgi:hypothetical protein